MLEQVSGELIPFFTLYLLLICTIALMFSVSESSEEIEFKSNEYPLINRLFSRFLSAIRLTLGNFTVDIGAIVGMPVGGVYIFYIFRFLGIVVGNLIFHKFIIAEVIKSYNKVNNSINMIMEKERMSLI